MRSWPLDGPFLGDRPPHPDEDYDGAADEAAAEQAEFESMAEAHLRPWNEDLDGLESAP